MVQYEQRAGMVRGEIPRRSEMAHETPTALFCLPDHVRHSLLDAAGHLETMAEAQWSNVERADRRPGDEGATRIAYHLGRRRGYLAAARVVRELARR